MSKIVVTHIRPDLDACASVWLVKRFMPNFAEAELEFVPSGDTRLMEPADADPQVLHVDTGMGKFDHHQFRERLSAAARIFAHLEKNCRFSKIELRALERLVELVTMIDNFEEVDFPNPTSDIYELSIVQILEGVKLSEKSDHVVMEFMLLALDGLFGILKRKVVAEEELSQAEEFMAKKHRCVFIKSKSKEASKLAEKSGFCLVLLQDPDRKNINIRVHPRAKFNLDKVYEAISKLEGEDKWFYHASGHLLLNGSNSHPQPATKLKVREIINIIQANL